MKHMFKDVSYADLIVLAGNTALEMRGATPLPFCGGRTDATESGSAGVMPPLLDESKENSLDDLRESALLLGVSPREWTALQAFRGMKMGTDGFSKYFKTLLFKDWEEVQVTKQDGTVKTLYKSIKGSNIKVITRSEYLLTLDPEFRSAAQDFASEPEM